MAEIYDCIGKPHEAVELLKNNNDNGTYDDLIGYIYSSSFYNDSKGIDYLSDSLVTVLSKLFHITFGLANYYEKFYLFFQKPIEN